MIKQALKVGLQWDAKYGGQLHGFAHKLKQTNFYSPCSTVMCREF